MSATSIFAGGAHSNARSFGDILKGHSLTKSRRTGEPVWRNSYYVGQIEDRVFRPIAGGKKRDAARWIGALRQAARKFELKTRAERQEVDPGARNGALGAVGIAVLDYLYEVVDYATGQLDPAVRTIADAIGHSYSAVHDALKRLRQHGFLEWMRRSKPKENPEPGGPQVEQASNAYALLVPPAMQSWIKRLLGRAPAAECDKARRALERAEFEAMLAQLTAREWLKAVWHGDSRQGGVLANIAAQLDLRDRQTANPAGPMKPGDYK